MNNQVLNNQTTNNEECVNMKKVQPRYDKTILETMRAEAMATGKCVVVNPSIKSEKNVVASTGKVQPKYSKEQIEAMRQKAINCSGPRYSQKEIETMRRQAMGKSNSTSLKYTPEMIAEMKEKAKASQVVVKANEYKG